MHPLKMKNTFLGMKYIMNKVSISIYIPYMSAIAQAAKGHLNKLQKAKHAPAPVEAPVDTAEGQGSVGGASPTAATPAASSDGSQVAPTHRLPSKTQMASPKDWMGKWIQTHMFSHKFSKYIDSIIRAYIVSIIILYWWKWIWNRPIPR